MEKLQVHSMCRRYPRLGDEDSAAVEKSIRETGVVDPVVWWKDENGKAWLIDGQNRMVLYDRIVKSGIDKALDGKPIKLPMVEFVGTELEAMKFVKARNMARRFLSPSQRSAIAVDTYHQELKLLKKAGQEPQENGDFAANLATEAGTNRSYIFQCNTLWEKAHDLLDKVIDGELSIPEAKAILANREAGKPDEAADEEGEGDGKSDANEEPPVVLDGMKNPVPPELAAIFITREDFKGAIRQLRKMRPDLEAMADGKGGDWLPKQELLAEVGNLTKLLAENMPHVACPYCSGTGKDADEPKKKCKGCKGAKYLSKLLWKVVPDDIKATVPGQEELVEA